MQPIQRVSWGVLAEILRRQPASKEKTAFAWQLVVGSALARATTVDLKDGVLAVRSTDERWIQEIRRAAPLVLGRLQDLLGADSVRSLHF